MSFKLTALILLAALFGAVLTFAGSGRAGGGEVGRYQITATDSRVWRVDTVTGALRTCFQVRFNGDRGYRCIDLGAGFQ